MERRSFRVFGLSAGLVILLACYFWGHSSLVYGQTSAKPGESPVRWGVPWPEQGKAVSGYPILPGVQSFEIYHATRLTGGYSHHPQIDHFKRRFFASWSNQQWDEDAPGQRVLCSISQDGRTWRPPFVCFPSLGGMRRRGRSGRVLTAEAWVVVGGTLYAVAGVNDKPGPDRKMAEGYETTVSGQKRMLVGGRVGWGRIARSVSTNGDLGPIFWLVDDPPPPLEDYPQFPDERDPQFKETAQAINRILANPLHMPAWDFLNHTTRVQAVDGHEMCEPSVYQRPDGALVKLSRDCGRPKSFRLYASVSKNGGKTWSTSVRTNIPDSPSKAVSGSLPDGKNYLIGNQVLQRVRDPLVIGLSPDGKVFNWAAAIRHGHTPVRLPGHAKDMGFQYPSAIVVGKALWVIYSIDKEDVEVSRIPLKELGSPKIR
ncbi:MAG TPA: exo-alpha-sialidase [Terriglobia bacterium]|nr:exo-alpha-sialidase [Terriglobia bacterium]